VVEEGDYPRQNSSDHNPRLTGGDSVGSSFSSSCLALKGGAPVCISILEGMCLRMSRGFLQFETKKLRFPHSLPIVIYEAVAIEVKVWREECSCFPPPKFSWGT